MLYEKLFPTIPVYSSLWLPFVCSFTSITALQVSQQSYFLLSMEMASTTAWLSHQLYKSSPLYFSQPQLHFGCFWTLSYFMSVILNTKLPFSLHNFWFLNFPAFSFTLDLLFPPVTTLDTQSFLFHNVFPSCPYLPAYQRSHRSQSCHWWLLWTLSTPFDSHMLTRLVPILGHFYCLLSQSQDADSCGRKVQTFVS